MNQKVKQQRSDQKGPDPTGSGSITLFLGGEIDQLLIQCYDKFKCRFLTLWSDPDPDAGDRTHILSYKS
jgi:hypothetical protein